MLKLLDIVGARPQFIKVSPILRAIDDHNETDPQDKIKEVLVHTGQHYDEEMSEVFFDQLEIKEPDYNLGVGSGSHGYQTGEMLQRSEDVFERENPDIVMVYGDTNSTLAGTLAASKLNIPIAHGEAGLRSYNREMPEEINRVLTDHASDILFCPTETAVDNLRKEGFTNIVNNGNLITDKSEWFPKATGNQPMAKTQNHKPQATGYEPIVLNVGDVMYDASLQNLNIAQKESSILKELNLTTSKYALATVHRPKNTDNKDNLKNIFIAFKEIANNDMPLVFPIHPRTEKKVNEYEVETGAVRVIPPVNYLDMITLEKNAQIILTDSGGIQKEAYFYKTPCVTLREETEWVETLHSGWNRLSSVTTQSIIKNVRDFNKGELGSNFYGNGNAAEVVVSLLAGL